ncbi:TPA: hypothetical protein ACH3X1_012449 [Trebouxia sp. C0004]
MGIQGLLPVVKPITNTVHVSKYRGQKVAVDAYCWLHKAAYCCAEEICEGKFTDKHVQYCMQKVQMLQQCGVQPIIVFDGGRLPMKAAEEGSRSRARKENKDKAAAHVKAGNKQAAYECYQRAVDISPATANDFAKALKAAGVEFIVAPFEADAQMAYLAVNDLVHSVITEDSDLLPYGCPRVLFKMDKAGEGQEVVAADLAQNRDPSFIGFTQQMFLEMCIFAGCDFLKALPGIGMKKAHQHVKRLKAHRKVCKSLRFSGVSVPRDYEQGFQRALWTFQHQRVWCPQRKQLVHLRPLPEGGLAAVDAVVGALADGDTDHDFLGPVQPDAVMQKVAEGELDPITLRPFPQPIKQVAAQVSPLETSSSQNQMRPWRPQRHSSDGAKRPLTLPVQANGIASYFPTLPSNGQASKQFSAPRPASKAAPSQPPFRHSCLGKRSSADAAQTDELQPATSGRFSHATSPAGKASRHLSGCGSQPELPQHAFAHFAAGKLPTSNSPSRPARSPTPDKTDSPFAGADSNSSAALSNLLARSSEPDRTDSPALRANSSCSAALANLLARSRMSTHTDVPAAVAAASAGISNNASSSGRLARSQTPEQTDTPAATAGIVNDLGSSNRIQHVFNIFAAGKGSALASSCRLADRRTADQSDSPAAATNSQSAQLVKAEPSPGGGGSGDDAERHAVADVGDAACADFYSTSPGGWESGDMATGRVPSGHLVSPFKDASRASWEQQCSVDRPASRKVSAHFGSLPKRPKTVEAEALPSDTSPFGVLGALLSKLKPQSPPSELDSSTNEDFDIDLGTNEDGTDDCMQEEGAGVGRDASSMEEQNGVSSMHHDPIAGLKHIQPFASIANEAVNNVKAASLRKFGMRPQNAAKKGRDRALLQPFAPPRRCNASQVVQQQATTGCKCQAAGKPPALQHFVCNVSHNESLSLGR